MKQYPIRVAYDYYHGTDRRKREKAQSCNRVAERVEKHLNNEVAKWADDSVGSIMSGVVASALREDSELVHRIIFSIDCGSNGVTI